MDVITVVENYRDTLLNSADITAGSMPATLMSFEQIKRDTGSEGPYMSVIWYSEHLMLWKMLIQSSEKEHRR